MRGLLGAGRRRRVDSQGGATRGRAVEGSGGSGSGGGGGRGGALSGWGRLPWDARRAAHSRVAVAAREGRQAGDPGTGW